MTERNLFLRYPNELDLRNALFHYQWEAATILTKDQKTHVIRHPEFVFVPRGCGHIRLDAYSEKGEPHHCWMIAVSNVESLVLHNVSGVIGRKEKDGDIPSEWEEEGGEEAKA